MKIFISYAREDAKWVVDIQQALEIHEVWVDSRLSLGQDWWSEIERQIAACDCVLFLLSPHSAASTYCQKELATAARLDKAIAPIMVEDMPIPDTLARYQVIRLTAQNAAEVMVRLLNGLFEIERQVFNPLKPPKTRPANAAITRLSVADLCFVTTSPIKKRMYEQILNTALNTSPIHLDDVQEVDAGVVAIEKALRAYDILKKPVYVEQAALYIRAWGGFPGGMTTAFIRPVGLHNVCKMLHPFEDRYAEAVSVIAFTDGSIRRKFVGTLPGVIAESPRGNSWGWNSIFIPDGFTLTLGEMSEEQHLSISSRRRAIIEFMRFLQANYEFA
jgi:non-canonical purine NTP pyrophosphatase (RdgB/HAM1 family)